MAEEAPCHKFCVLFRVLIKDTRGKTVGHFDAMSGYCSLSAELTRTRETVSEMRQDLHTRQFANKAHISKPFQTLTVM